MLREFFWQIQFFLWEHGVFLTPRQFFGRGFWLLLGLETLREIYLLFVLPRRAEKHARRGETERAIALLRPVAFGFAPVLGLRNWDWQHLFRLAQLLAASSRHGEALDVWNRLLQKRGLVPSFEAEVRRRRADSLENTGDKNGADADRAQAEQLLARGDGASQKLTGWNHALSSAKSRVDAQDFAGALPLFDAALAAPKPGISVKARREIECEIWSHKMLAAHSAGRYDFTREAGEKVLELASRPWSRAVALRMLALCASNNGEHERAIELSRDAVGENQKEGDPDIVADGKAHLALMLQNTGRVREALAVAQDALQPPAKISRIAAHTAAACCILLGQWQSARDYLQTARESSPVSAPHAERLMQGLFNIEQANLETFATIYDGQNTLQTAWDCLQRAKPLVGQFERIHFWISVNESHVLALLGQSETAKNLISQIETRLPDFKGDDETQRMALPTLARALSALGEHERAIEWWEKYLAFPHVKPVYLPGALLAFGDTLAAQGNAEKARQKWREAAEMTIESRAVEIARDRLK